MTDKVYLITSIFLNSIGFIVYPIDKAITVKNESDNEVIMIIATSWCTPGHSGAEKLFYALIEQTRSNLNRSELKIPLINNIFFCSPVSPHGGTVTYRPEKFSAILGIVPITVKVWDPVKDLLGSKGNTIWGDVIIYPHTINLEHIS